MTQYENIILIPYRNRKEHLTYFLEHSWVLIKEHLPNSKLVIIEQDEGKLFNRGKILNVGFKEYLDKTNNFITHDVDINPNNKGIELYNNTNFNIIRIYCGHYTSLGGICKMSSSAISKINGFPNHIWGWGIEDRALFYRAKIMDASISPLYNNNNLFTRLNHKSNAEHYTGDKKKISDLENEIYNCNNKDRQLKHIMSSGLNNLDYTILERTELEPHVELIKVKL